jgi:hypothetical protein
MSSNRTNSNHWYKTTDAEDAAAAWKAIFVDQEFMPNPIEMMVSGQGPYDFYHMFLTKQELDRKLATVAQAHARSFATVRDRLAGL